MQIQLCNNATAEDNGTDFTVCTSSGGLKNSAKELTVLCNNDENIPQSVRH